MNVNIDVNTAQLKKIIAGVPDKIVKPALVTSINRAARDGKSAAIRATVSVTGVKRKAISKRITGAKGNAAAKRKKPNAMIFVRTDEGVKISQAINKTSIKKFATRKSFNATMPSGHFGAFERTGKPKRAAKKGRYYGKVSSRGPGKGRPIKREPIQEIKIPLHPHGTAAAKRAFVSKAKEVLPKELKRNIERKINAQKASN